MSKSLVSILRRTHRPTAKLRELLDGYAAERRSVIEQIEGGWAGQTRRPTVEEIDRWMGIGRS